MFILVAFSFAFGLVTGMLFVVAFFTQEDKYDE